jgi:hypothetical protein
MRKTRLMAALAASAGLWAGAAGQDVTLHFDADRAVAGPGETVHWVVSASFTGYPDPTAYFGGFVGDFPASDPSLGDGMNYVSFMTGNATTPTFDGASIEGINFFNSALLGSDDPSNPIDVFEFDVRITALSGTLSSDAEGVVSVFPSDFIFALPDEYPGMDVIVSDTVIIGSGPSCNPADLVAPFGRLSGQDICAFLQFFLNLQSPADFNEDGIWDILDIVAFVEAFVAGCP